MALASYIISFALGIISIDMFCDHYSLISPSLTPTQFNTCTSYYQNVFYQPWYTSLVTLLPISIGAIILIRNIKRTIYDTLSIPLFLAVVGLFLRIKKNIELLTVETQANNSAKEGYLKAIAYDHATIGVLLILLLILQVLAGKKAKIPVKKNL